MVADRKWLAMLLVMMAGGMFVAGVQGSASPDGLHLQPNEANIHRRLNASFGIMCNGPELEWLGPKRKPVEDSTRIQVRGNATYKILMFPSLGMGENGTYTCRSKADKSEKSFSLTVTEPVSFEGSPQQTARQNQNATLQCLPRGSPKLEISWLHNGNVVSRTSDKFKIANGKLIVRNVTRNDAGPYVCRVVQYLFDESEMHEHIIHLTVEHGPEWHSDYAKNGDRVYGYLGGLANLTCVVEAQPLGNITWLRGSTVIKPGKNATIFGDGGNSTLQLNLTDASMFSSYTCKATNPLATRERVLTLTWGMRPPVPSAPQPMKAADARHALIRVDRPSPPSAPPTAAGPGQPVPTSLDLVGLRLLVRPANSLASKDIPPRVVDLPFNEDNEYVLPDLQPNTWYEVRAQWRNAAGLSEISEPGEIHTSEISSSAIVHSGALPLLIMSQLFIIASSTASILSNDAILSS